MAGSEVTERQMKRVAVPKRFTLPMREIWTLQPRFETIKGQRPLRLLTHPRFRAGYDFLVLRAESGEAAPELAEWWTKFQTLDPEEQKKLLKGQGKAKRRRRPRRKTKAAAAPDTQV